MHIPRRTSPSYIFKFIYLFILVGGGAERHRENPKQALSCQHRAQGRDPSYEPQDHDLSQNQELGA